MNAKSSISYGTATVVISGDNSFLLFMKLDLAGGSMYIFGRLGEMLTKPTFQLRKDLLSVDENKSRQCEELRNLIISDAAIGDKYCIAISSTNTIK